MAEIELHNRKGKVVARALLDEEHFEEMNKYPWCLSRNGYASRGSRLSDPPHPTRSQYTIFLHRQILELPFGDPAVVDHINGNPLDNRRRNLRITDHQGNSQNRQSRGPAQPRGVCWNQKSRKWQAGCKINNKSYHLGLFETREAAAAAAAAFRAARMPGSIEALRERAAA